MLFLPLSSFILNMDFLIHFQVPLHQLSVSKVDHFYCILLCPFSLFLCKIFSTISFCMRRGKVQYTEAKTARTRHSQIQTHTITSALTDTDTYTRTNRLTNAETRDTDILTHLPQRQWQRDDQYHSLPRTSMFRRFHVSSAGLESSVSARVCVCVRECSP